MLYASRLDYIRRCTEHSAEDFFKVRDVLGMKSMTSEILLSFVKKSSHFSLLHVSNQDRCKVTFFSQKSNRPECTTAITH